MQPPVCRIAHFQPACAFYARLAHGELTGAHGPPILPRSAAGEDKVSGKRITATTCTSSKVMGFLAQLLQTPYGDKVGGGGV